MSETRKLCLNCSLKHLGQALVLLAEAVKGYPLHKYIAMGHLAEAEDECIAKYPKMAEKIRDTRLAVQEDYTPNNSIDDLISQLHDIKESDGSGCDVC
jgi:hypothetical protein